MSRRLRHSGYFEVALRPEVLKKWVPKMVKAIQTTWPELEAIAFRGVSGALLAPILAYRLGVPVIAVRKELSGSHASELVEGTVDITNYIIVDDLVASGDTIAAIRRDIRQWGCKATCDGALLYNYFCLDYGHNQVKALQFPVRDNDHCGICDSLLRDVEE